MKTEGITMEDITMEKPYTFSKQVINKVEEFVKTFVYANGKPVLPIQMNGMEKWALYSGIYTVIDVSSPIW